jgi:hypothetical protein
VPTPARADSSLLARLGPKQMGSVSPLFPGTSDLGVAGLYSRPRQEVGICPKPGGPNNDAGIRHTSGSSAESRLERIVELSARYKVCDNVLLREFIDVGGLLCYGAGINKMALRRRGAPDDQNGRSRALVACFQAVD